MMIRKKKIFILSFFLNYVDLDNVKFAHGPIQFVQIKTKDRCANIGIGTYTRHQFKQAVFFHGISSSIQEYVSRIETLDVELKDTLAIIFTALRPTRTFSLRISHTRFHGIIYVMIIFIHKIQGMIIMFFDGRHTLLIALVKGIVKEKN